MKSLAMLLVVLGVCLAAQGAAGMHTPMGTEAEGLERHAIVLFGLGIAALATGGILVRLARRASVRAEATRSGGAAAYRTDIDAIRRIVVELDEAKGSLSPAAIQDRIARLMAEEYFDLTSKSDDLILLVGFNDYARVWEGVAVAERLLNRCWSMVTDGHPEEGARELAHARRSIEQAAEAMAAL